MQTTTAERFYDDQAQREAHLNRLKLVGIYLGVALISVAIGLILWLLILVRITQTQTAPLTHQIDSCTDSTTDDGDPVGECYAASQAQTQKLVGIPAGPINTVTVLATYCQVTKGAHTVPAIVDCVDRELQRLRQQPQ